MAQTKLTITHDLELVADLKHKYQVTSDRPKVQAAKIVDLVQALADGVRMGSMVVAMDAGDGVQASGTVTLASHVATDTVTINGVVFTCVASGATGNQYNVGTDTVTAANLAAAINASASAVVSSVVVATSAAAVVTVKAISAGQAGNMMTIAISAHGSVSGAKLTGGTESSSSTSIICKFGV